MVGYLAIFFFAQSPFREVPYAVKLETIMEHDDGKFLWYHPRAASFPNPDGNSPRVLMTLQKHLRTSDHYSGLFTMERAAPGGEWSPPAERPELAWRSVGEVDVAVADVTPGWHPQTKKLLAIGAEVRYSRAGKQLEDVPRSNQTAYAVYDPAKRTWSGWKRLEMPPGSEFNFARSACSQWLVRPDGKLLLPFYFGPSQTERFRATVVEASFDGETIKHLRQGTEFRLEVVRGLAEPSIAEHRGRWFLTVRNDLAGYVSSSADGLAFAPLRKWTFDDGKDLGSYNTQQHWLSRPDGLFLIYTRRGANNDHIIRHRAPLFIAQVDPEKFRVVRRTERILIPERGGEFGNFGAGPIDENESWVTVGEGVWSDSDRKRGARGALYVARILWNAPAAKGGP
ncbi:MAG TPA: sialidase family protein [Planctomycetia bacterium]|nr:sialidase family protein [Planctomycetia bacterium]